MAKVSKKEREKQQWVAHCKLIHKVWQERAEGFGGLGRFTGFKDDELFWDTAIIGIGRQHGGDYVFVYSEEKLVEAYVNQARIMHGDDRVELYDEASEYVSFNITCAYLGPKTPIIVNTYEAS